MNTRQKLAKMILITVLVASASFVTRGLVSAGIDSRTYTDPQFRTATYVERELNTVDTILLIRINSSDLDVFKQYYALLEKMECKQIPGLGTGMVNQSDDSKIRFEQYLQYAR